jgi:hypothetical protein
MNRADPKLLAAGNYTEYPTIEVLKKAAADYRKKMNIDESIFTECRILTRTYLKDDVTSAHLTGESSVNLRQQLSYFYRLHS